MIWGGSTSRPILRKSKTHKFLNKLKNDAGSVGVAALIRSLVTSIESGWPWRRSSSFVVSDPPERTASFGLGDLFFFVRFLGDDGGCGNIMDIPFCCTKV